MRNTVLLLLSFILVFSSISLFCTEELLCIFLMFSYLFIFFSPLLIQPLQTSFLTLSRSTPLMWLLPTFEALCRYFSLRVVMERKISTKSDQPSIYAFGKKIEMMIKKGTKVVCMPLRDFYSRPLSIPNYSEGIYYGEYMSNIFLSTHIKNSDFYSLNP